MSLETWQAKYPVFESGKFENLSLRQIVGLRKEMEPRPFIWSARLSSGLFGLTGCPAGNSPHAPKGENEVLLALGDNGLRQLIDMGFLPCPTCHPEDTENFWEKTKGIIGCNYPELSDTKQILDRNIVPFDARRVEWEVVAPYLSKMPNRLYVLPNLDEQELGKFKQRINDIGFSLPPTGFYDRTSPTRFTEYIIR
ncbi:MAG TPA: hypothetical protein VMR19_02910 [Candidatus Saccharimonadales bacterium]|jgi:hypothetical protein|nr:hypothetical protein [Candidatus Saccharimonadales bacterium]